MSRTRIKICGLFRPEDAAAVNAARPDYAGFVFHTQSRRYVTPEQARALRSAITPAIRTVGVFVDTSPEDIADLYRAGIIGAVQLHGGEDESYLTKLRRLLPGAEIWKAFVIRSEEDLCAAAKSTADRVLLDGGAGGGTPFPWGLAERFPRPFFLAGGLTPETIPEAVRRLHPWGVDLSSGVETESRKDPAKIMAAVQAAGRS